MPSNIVHKALVQVMHLIRMCSAKKYIESDLFSASYQALFSPEALGVADPGAKVGYA